MHTALYDAQYDEQLLSILLSSLLSNITFQFCRNQSENDAKAVDVAVAKVGAVVCALAGVWIIAGTEVLYMPRPWPELVLINQDFKTSNPKVKLKPAVFVEARDEIMDRALAGAVAKTRVVSLA